MVSSVFHGRNLEADRSRPGQAARVFARHARGGCIFVSGTLGTKPGSFELVPGGAKAETKQTLENIRAILRAAGADLSTTW